MDYHPLIANRPNGRRKTLARVGIIAGLVVVVTIVVASLAAVFATSKSQNAPEPVIRDSFAIPEVGDVVINEMMPFGTEKWIELYNKANVRMNLSGHRIFCVPSFGSEELVIPEESFIDSGGFFVMRFPKGDAACNEGFAFFL